MKSQFAADFEAYMPTEFNGEPYGKSGRLSLANEASINVCVVFRLVYPPARDHLTRIYYKRRLANLVTYPVVYLTQL